jgi:hypothetical protein
MTGSIARLTTTLATLALGALLLLTPRTARAQRQLLTPTGGKGTLAIDNITGLRVNAFTGISYAGPLGISTQRYSVDPVAPGDPNQTFHSTTIWLAPAADYFLIDHLSIGGFVELASVSGSVDSSLPGVGTVNNDLPTTTNFTLLPRIGYLIPIGDRFAIWPRGGIGYAYRGTSSLTGVGGRGGGGGFVTNKESFSALVIDVNVDFLFRINETFFLVGAPEVGASLGGSHTNTQGGIQRSSNANVLQFSVLTGLGIFFDL